MTTLVTNVTMAICYQSDQCVTVVAMITAVTMVLMTF